MTERPPLSARLRVAVLAAHAALLAGVPLAGGLTGAVLALPLLAPLPGLWRGRPYTYAWASMLVVFYIAGLLVARSPLTLALAGIGALEFLALVLFVRARSVEAQRAAPPVA
ncbi:MAG: DUF2069 domain-containing protein [Nevskiaceae bacterium]